jgi:CheY-like chemotaxis protein
MPPTVLCVDDDRHLCQILEKAMSEQGYAVLLAHDGEQALAIAAEAAPDLLLLNVSLPRCDGFQVLEKIRAMPEPEGQVPVLLVCNSRPTPRYEERAQALGAQALLAKPVPLKQLLERVGEHVKSPAPPVSERRPKRAKKGPPVQGKLSEVSLPQLLHSLHGLRASGVLLVSSGKKRKAVQLLDGCPVAVKSNLVDECLGNYLVRKGKLSREDLSESLTRMEKGDGLQGQVLVAMQVLDEEEIARALRAQAEEKLFDIFSWTRGSFRLEMGGRLKGGNTLALGASAANVIVEGLRRCFPLARIDADLASWGKRFVARGHSPFYRLQDIELSPEEEALLAGIDGSRRLEEFTTVDKRARRTLYGLLITEMLELRAEPDGEKISPEPMAAPVPRPRAEASPVPEAERDRMLRVELTAMAEKLRGKNYFEILEIPETAGDLEVNRAYDQLASKAHPDHFTHASSSVRQMADDVFQLLTEAHETLSQPRRRTEYLLERRKGERVAAKLAVGERALAAEVEFQKGEILMRQREYEGAMLCFGKALEYLPEEGEYHAHYGWSLHLCNPDNSVMVEEAIEHVKRGIKLAREQEKPYLFLGRLYKAVGHGVAAEKMFTRAVQIRPDCVEAMRELRLINLRRDKSRGLIGRLFRR